MSDTHWLVRRARAAQLFVVTLGMALGFIVPVLSTVDGVPFWVPMLMLCGWLATPLAFVAFGGSVERAADALGAPPNQGVSARTLALIMFVPGASIIVTPLLVRTLARRTAALVDDGALAHRAFLFACAGSAWSLLLGPLTGAFVAAVTGLQVLAIAAGPLGSLALLGLATQLVVQPLIDRAGGHAAPLGAIGADTSTAFSSGVVDDQNATTSDGVGRGSGSNAN